MGIDYSGGMIIGCKGNEVSEPDDYEDGFVEWLEENDMTYMSLYYDADKENQYVGFLVQDVSANEIEGKWLDNVKKLAIRFKELTGQDASLIGTQDIY